MHKPRRTSIVAFAIVILLGLGSCGELHDDYFYSVNVINNTDAQITVRYDWDTLFIVYEWFGEERLQPKESRIIEWYSGDMIFDTIEAEYQGKKKQYTVTQLATVVVSTLDFQ